MHQQREFPFPHAIDRACILLGLFLTVLCTSSFASPPTRLYATTTTNHLISFTAGAVSLPLLTDVPITGLGAGEVMGGIDFRPSTGELYGITRNGTLIRIYRIDVTTGAATLLTTQATSVAGTAYGFSFDTQIDKIRLVTDATVNMRIDPANGQITVDNPLAYASGDTNVNVTPKVAHLAHTPQYAPSLGMPVTTTYGIDIGAATSRLVRIGAPNGVNPSTGQLFTIGSFNGPPNGIGGFDIDGSNDTAYIAYQSTPGNNPLLYRIDLTTGAKEVGVTVIFTNGVAIDGLAIAQVDSCSDIDGNGKIDALTDGLLSLRAQFGLTGTAVTNGAIGPGAIRTTWADIRHHMNMYCGMTWRQ
jgi:hypothetical protein